jgi:hypothetical protein
METLESIIETINELTESNNHGLAILAASRYCDSLEGRRSNITRKIALVNELHELEGHLSGPLEELRNECLSNVRKRLVLNLSSKVWSNVNL